MGKKLLDAATKTGLAAAKTAFKKVIYKTAEATAVWKQNRWKNFETKTCTRN